MRIVRSTLGSWDLVPEKCLYTIIFGVTVQDIQNVRVICGRFLYLLSGKFSYILVSEKKFHFGASGALSYSKKEYDR